MTATFSGCYRFRLTDVTVSGAKSNFAGSGTTYTFDLTPSGDGTITVDIAASVAVDTAGSNDAATQFQPFVRLLQRQLLSISTVVTLTLILQVLL